MESPASSSAEALDLDSEKTNHRMTEGDSEMNARIKWTLAALAAALTGGLVLSGCGSSGDPTMPATAVGSTSAAPTTLAACDPFAPPPAVGQNAVNCNAAAVPAPAKPVATAVCDPFAPPPAPGQSARC
jgi:hypothetical protein